MDVRAMSSRERYCSPGAPRWRAPQSSAWSGWSRRPPLQPGEELVPWRDQRAEIPALGITSGAAGETNLGALPAVWSITGVLYLLGGVLLGIATFRAGVLPLLAAGVLAVGTVAPLALSLLPHELVRLAAVPVGIALAWLGYALWSERRGHASELLPGRAAPAASRTVVATNGGDV